MNKNEAIVKVALYICLTLGFASCCGAVAISDHARYNRNDCECTCED